MLAVIGGTGFAEFAGLENVELIDADTAWGMARLQRGTLDGTPCLFLPRHGLPAVIPPHKINYRANVQALADNGASGIVSVTAVGSVNESLDVPQVVIPDQIIDYTWGREQTFFVDRIHHIDSTWPYDAAMRGKILEAAAALCAEHPEVACNTSGVYGCTQGPRLETAAEIRRLRRDGCDIVGMTAMPEAALARELELPYAALSIVINPGAGMGGKEINLDAIGPAIERGMAWARWMVRFVAANS